MLPAHIRSEHRAGFEPARCCPRFADEVLRPLGHLCVWRSGLDFNQRSSLCRAEPGHSATRPIVELEELESSTSSLRTKRSGQLSYNPMCGRGRIRTFSRRSRKRQLTGRRPSLPEGGSRPCFSGAGGTRILDLLHAMQALWPTELQPHLFQARRCQQDSNLQPSPNRGTFFHRTPTPCAPVPKPRTCSGPIPGAVRPLGSR